MGLDIKTEVIAICDGCGFREDLLSKSDDDGVINRLVEALERELNWGIDDTVGGFACFCPNCRKPEVN